MKKRLGLLLAIVALVLVLVLWWGRSRREEVKMTLDKDLSVLQSGDYQDIYALIYNQQYLGQDLKMNKEENLISFFLSQASIRLSKVRRGQVYLTVTSHDMRDFIGKNQQALNRVSSEEELITLLSQFYQQQEELVFEDIPLTFSSEDGHILIDYDNYDFKNAVSGGFLESYQAFRQEVGPEKEEGGEKSDGGEK